jgi:hypothetical protein
MSRIRKLDFDKITAVAIRTAKWATTMTRWRIGFETRGKRLAKASVNPARRWQLVGFPGPAGRESAGIVDLIAIRKDHSTRNGAFKRGDGNGDRLLKFSIRDLFSLRQNHDS